VIRPVEIHQTHIRPADFFTKNPALDVPSTKNDASILVSSYNGTSERPKTPKKEAANGVSKPDAQKDPVAHLQGTGPDIDPQSIGNTPASVKDSPKNSTTSIRGSVRGSVRNSARTSVANSPVTSPGKDKKRLSTTLKGLFNRKEGQS
jgi:hypothetical protein